MSQQNPLIANNLIAPIDRTSANPPISFGGSGSEEGNSGTGIYGDQELVVIACEGSAVMQASAAGVSVQDLPITDLADPVDPQDAATKAYVDGLSSPNEVDSSASFTFTSIGTVTNKKVWTQQIGNVLYIRGSCTVGTAAVATFSINMSGITIDVARMGIDKAVAVGMAYQLSPTNANLWEGGVPLAVFVDQSQTGKLYVANQAGTSAGTFDKANGNTFYDNQPMCFEARIPIVVA